MTERNRTIRVKRLHDPEPDDLVHPTAAERIGMLWQLTLDAWAFMGEPVAEPRLQRQAVRVIRRGQCRLVDQGHGSRKKGEQHDG